MIQIFKLVISDSIDKWSILLAAAYRLNFRNEEK